MCAPARSFQEGHIPGSQNIPPCPPLEEAANLTENKGDPAVRLLLQRSQKRPGGPCAAAHGVRQCEKYRRHRHLDRSGGALIEKLGPKGARRGQIRAEPLKTAAPPLLWEAGPLRVCPPGRSVTRSRKFWPRGAIMEPSRFGRRLNERGKKNSGWPRWMRGPAWPAAAV